MDIRHFPQAYIASTGVCLPTQVKTENLLTTDAEQRRQRGQLEEVNETYERLAKGTGIKSRHSVCPCWFPENCASPEQPMKSRPHSDLTNDTQEPPVVCEDIFTPYQWDPPAYLRAREWIKSAPQLAIRAARDALKNWKFGTEKDISHVVTTATTGWAEPGLACALIEELGLSHDTQKIEVNINGCFAGASCIRTARDIIRGGEATAVLVVAVEIASLQYNITDTDVNQLVVNSLFGDGAGAAIISKQGKWAMETSKMSLVPNSKNLLKLTPNLENSGSTTKMTLSPIVAKSLGDYFTTGGGVKIIENLSQMEFVNSSLAVHPGGPRILNALTSVFENKGWQTGCMQDSFDVLQKVGNLGSAAILVVLHNVLNNPSTKEKVAYFAFGPGVTVEWGALKAVSPPQ